MLDSAEQKDEESEDVTDEHDASDDTNTTKTDVSDILSLEFADSKQPLSANSALDGLWRGVIESEVDTNTLLNVTTAVDSPNDVVEKLPENMSEVLSKDTSLQENIKSQTWNLQ